MAEATLIYLDQFSTAEQLDTNKQFLAYSFLTESVKTYTKLTDLFTSITIEGASELDLDSPTVLIIKDGNQQCHNTTGSQLNNLEIDAQIELLEYFCYHFNLLIYKFSELNISQIKSEISKYKKVLKNRILRVESWAGLNYEISKQDLRFLNDMKNTLNFILNNSPNAILKLQKMNALIAADIRFKDLLVSLTKPEEFYCYCIGTWCFIAQELTCDELTFCAFMIFKICFALLEPDNELILSDNDLLNFLFAVRNSYRGGNSFHNFRHAVDVLQSTFYLLIKINCIPPFKYYSADPSANPIESYNNKMVNPDSSADANRAEALLNPVQTLSLLVASLGHDVGHPGLTNAFLVEHNSPIAKIYSNQSVLENFHSSFFNEILSVYWPVFLNNSFISSSNLTNTKNLEITSIMATDMANHYEYVKKIDTLKPILTKEISSCTIKNDLELVKLILSLIIKLSDISNVSRPLPVSIKWGLSLSREFKEIEELTRIFKTAGGNQQQEISNLIDERKFQTFPNDIAAVLSEFPNLPGSQLFFITQFADGLFKEVSNILPELSFTYNILQQNKQFWLAKKAEQPS